jgi:hypothetical protein
MTNMIRMPGYVAEVSLSPPSRAYRSTSSNGRAVPSAVATALSPLGQEACDPFCVCQKGITAENCPCCGYDRPGSFPSRGRGRK